jgi:hypothetical protein
MRHGWELKYGTKFRGGKEKFYIWRAYRIGAFRFLNEGIDLNIDEANRIAELIQERKIDVSERKQS